MDRACAPVLSSRMDGFSSLFCVRYRLRCRFVCAEINVDVWCLHVEANIILMFFSQFVVLSDVKGRVGVRSHCVLFT
jgi:hypothetical protein